jgi:hypothetical protein
MILDDGESGEIRNDNSKNVFGRLLVHLGERWRVVDRGRSGRDFAPVVLLF